MAQNKVLKNIPKMEDICIRLRNEAEELTHIITEKKMSFPKEFILYEVTKENTYVLIGKGNNPNKLEDKYVYKRKEKE